MGIPQMKSFQSKYMQQEVDTMTPEELSTAIAEAMGWKKIKKRGWDFACWVDKYEAIMSQYSNWVPCTSWQDFGLVYDHMRRNGWKPESCTLSNGIEWGWYKNDIGLDYYSAKAPNLRTAMVKSAVKALRGEKGE